MILKTVKLFIILLLVGACKKTEVSGYVYSKSNVPLSGQDVKIYYHIGSQEGLEGHSDVTDANGHYNIVFRDKRGRAYTVKCENDSSNDWQPINDRQTNQINLYLK